MRTIRMPNISKPAGGGSTAQTTTVRNGVTEMYLLTEALSKVRMRRPQAGGNTRTEAPRSARSVTIEARRRAERDLGL